MFNRPVSQHSANNESLVTNIHDLKPENIRETARYLQENFFSEKYNSNENWDFAVSLLEGLSNINPNAVRDGLKYLFPTINYTLNDYRQMLVKSLGASQGNAIVDNLIQLANKLNSQGTPKIVCINATFSGGGVAEMLKTAGSILAQCGIEIEWHILYPHHSDFYNVTKAIHNTIQGNDKKFSEYELNLWEEVSKRNAHILQSVFTDPSIGHIFIEDPQPAYLIKYGRMYSDATPISYRIHIDISGIKKKNPGAIQIWNALLENISYLGKKDTILFQPFSVPAIKTAASIFIQAPGIDLLNPKNKTLSKEETRNIIKKINKEQGLSINVDKPTLVTGSRFDYWKNLIGVLRVFEQIGASFPELDLIVFGNYATDDPEGVTHYEIIRFLIDHSEFSARIHLVTNYAGKEIGALYRLAAMHNMPYFGPSIKEGFNLMVNEAAVQGAVPFTSDVGGMKRFASMDNLSQFQIKIDQIAMTIEDASELYNPEYENETIVKINIHDKAIQLEKALYDRINALLELRRENKDDYDNLYQKAADEAKKHTAETSLLTMLYNYLSLSAATIDDLDKFSNDSDTTPTTNVLSKLLK